MGRELSFAPDFVMRTELMDKLRELYELFDNISHARYGMGELNPSIPEPIEPLLSVTATFSRNRKLGNLPMDEVVTVLHNLTRTKDPKGLKMLSDICAIINRLCKAGRSKTVSWKTPDSRLVEWFSEIDIDAYVRSAIIENPRRFYNIDTAIHGWSRKQ